MAGPLEQSDSDNNEEEEEEVNMNSDNEVHNYAQIPDKITANSIIGQKLLAIYRKDPRPTVERKKEIAKNLNIEYKKLKKWFETRISQDIKGNLSNTDTIISHNVSL